MIVISIVLFGAALFFEGFALSCRKNRSFEQKDGGTVLYFSAALTVLCAVVLAAALFAGNGLRRVFAGFSPFFGLVAALTPCFLALSTALKNEYFKKDGRTGLFSVVSFYKALIFAAFMCGLSLGFYSVLGVGVFAVAGVLCGVVFGLAINPDAGERLERTAQFLAALCYFAGGVLLILNNAVETWQ